MVLGACFRCKYWGILQGVMVEGLLCPFFSWVCGISIGCMLGGEVWWFVGKVEAIGTSRNFVSARLPPCSLRMPEALCDVGVNWMVYS